MKSLTPGSFEEDDFVFVVGKPVTMDTSSFEVDDRFERLPLNAPSFASNSSSPSCEEVFPSSSDDDALVVVVIVLLLLLYFFICFCCCCA